MQFVAADRFAELKATGKLPSPKGVALSIIRLLQHDDYRMGDLSQLVQSDPAIAGRLLYFANAAAFGRSRPIASLQRAIVALGSFRVRDLVIGLSVMHNNRAGWCTEFDYEIFWGHSLATGIACQSLAHIAQFGGEEIFTLGLLSRIGELALATLFPDDYAEILIKVRISGTAIESLERKRFQFDHHQLTASLLCEWGLPEVLVQAAYHHESPEAADFATGSRVQTLAYTLSLASALAQLCVVDEDARWALLPEILKRAARLGISGETLQDLVDRIVVNWRDWGAKLQVRTRDIPPFAEILAATPPVRRMGSLASGEDRRSRQPRLNVQLFGLLPDERKPMMHLVENMGHHPVLIEASAESHLLKHPAQIVIADATTPGFDATAFCRKLRHGSTGEDCYLLLLASPESEHRSLEMVDAGADDVLIKPVNEQALRVHLTTAVRMLVLREQIHQERQGVMRSTVEFASTQKKLLQDALTDELTQLPNRRHGMDFLISELVLTRASGAPLALLMLDIDYFKKINDIHGHAAGDAVLRQLATILRSTARAEDLVFRYGGEEFATILASAPLSIARQIAERMRLQVETASFEWEGKLIPVTISIGVAMADAQDKNGQALIQAADAALYEAKKAGRNRVMAHIPPAT